MTASHREVTRELTEASNITEAQAVAEFLATQCEVSFGALFDILYPKVVCFFVVRGVDQSTAEELAQDVLAAVYRHVAVLRDHHLFFGWLFRIARNRLLQHIRKQRHEIETVAIDELDASIGQIRSNGPADCELRDWLQCLEPQEQQIMLLRYSEDLAYQEIAAVLGIPLGTVKWKIFNAKAKLGINLKK